MEHCLQVSQIQLYNLKYRSMLLDLELDQATVSIRTSRNQNLHKTSSGVPIVEADQIAEYFCIRDRSGKFICYKILLEFSFTRFLCIYLRFILVIISVNFYNAFVVKISVSINLGNLLFKMGVPGNAELSLQDKTVFPLRLAEC